MSRASRGPAGRGGGPAQARRPDARQTTPPGPAAQSRVGEFAAAWAPVAGRVLLALVLAWFGAHELLRPGLWTGYVPVVSSSSTLAILAVLAHGWVLLVLAVALAAGIATRLAAVLAAAVLLEIVISLTVTAGLSDLTLRDVGVLGLAITVAGVRRQRLALRR